MRNTGGNGNQSGQPAPIIPVHGNSTGTVKPVHVGNNPGA